MNGNRSRAFCCALIAFSFLAGFAAGWTGRRQFKISVSPQVQRSYLELKGDAPPVVREQILATFRRFQEGYRQRDLRQLAPFMDSFFSRDQDIRVIGTDMGEWHNGYNSVAEFIRDDWKDWGDVRLSVDDAAVDVNGETAWLATTGNVHEAHSLRAIRFTAVMTKVENRWMFRQIQFQWDERMPRLRDLIRRSW